MFELSDSKFGDATDGDAVAPTDGDAVAPTGGSESVAHGSVQGSTGYDIDGPHSSDGDNEVPRGGHIEESQLRSEVPLGTSEVPCYQKGIWGYKTIRL